METFVTLRPHRQLSALHYQVGHKFQVEESLLETTVLIVGDDLTEDSLDFNRVGAANSEERRHTSLTISSNELSSGCCRIISTNRSFAVVIFASSSPARKSGEPALGQVIKDVLEVLLQLIEGFSLGHVIGKLFDVAQPHIVVLPIDAADRFHGFIVPQPVERFNV